MPNATVRANAQTLPEATNCRVVLGAVLAGGAPPPADDQPQSSRRGFLRFLGALAPAVGLAGVPASGARAVKIEIDPALLAIARRAVGLEEEYELARQARSDARQTFYDLCGPVPKALRIKGGDVVHIAGPQHLATMSANWLRHQELTIISAAWMRRIAATKDSKSPLGRRIRHQLKIAEAYEAHREASAKASGIRAAEERFAAVNAEIDVVVEDVIRHEPRPVARLLAFSRCFGPDKPLAQAVTRLFDHELRMADHEDRDRVLGSRAYTA
jgi:hypothetical protein